MEDLESEAERRMEPLRDVRFQRAAPGIEDVLDVDLRLRGHAPQDARDERPVSPVGPDRGALTGPGPGVGIAVDVGEPGEGLRRTRHQPCVGLEDPHLGAAVPADRGIRSRRRINLLRLRGRAGIHYLRGGQHVIRRRDPRAQFGVDEVEQAAHVGLLTVRSIHTATRVQAEKHDVPDNSLDRYFLDTTVVRAEDLQYPFRPADPQALRGLRGPSRPGEVLFADENLTPGVHEGNATGVQVVVFFGVVAETADFDRDFALAESVDDDLGLRDGLSLKRRCERAVPVILSCHCALPNYSFT